MTKRVLALIPARGGSKGIPNKNLALLKGKPLIQWTIDAALQSSTITDTLVSSDADTILAYSKKSGVNTLLRPPSLATDTAPMPPTIVHAIQHLIAQDKHYDYICLLQPTSPLRKANDIDAAMEQLLCHQAQSVISVTALEKNPLKSFLVTNEGYLTGIANNEYPFMCRQDLPPVYAPNGAIYIVETEAFMRTESLLQEKTVPYCMPANNSTDIDTTEDLHLAAEQLP